MRVWLGDGIGGEIHPCHTSLRPRRQINVLHWSVITELALLSKGPIVVVNLLRDRLLSMIADEKAA